MDHAALALLTTLALAASPADVGALLQPWQHLDAEVVDHATVVLTGTYREEEAHEVRSGVDLTLLRSQVVVQSVLRGKAGEAPVDLDLLGGGPGPRPPYYVEGRTYLVLLRPGPDTRRRLARGGTTLRDRVPAAEILAVVDLSMTEEEAMGLSAEASRRGEWRGVPLDPEIWGGVRAGGEAGAIREVLPALVGLVLVDGADQGDVEAWLGAPDVRWSPTHVEYTLGLDLDREAHGATWGQLVLHYADETLLRWELRHVRLDLTAGGSASRVLDAAASLEGRLPTAGGPREAPPWRAGQAALVHAGATDVPLPRRGEIKLLPFAFDPEPVEAWRYDLCVEAGLCAARTVAQPGPPWQPAVGMPWKAAAAYCRTRDMAAQSSNQALVMRDHGPGQGPDLVEGGPRDLVRAGFRCTRVDD